MFYLRTCPECEIKLISADMESESFATCPKCEGLFSEKGQLSVALSTYKVQKENKQSSVLVDNAICCPSCSQSVSGSFYLDDPTIRIWKCSSCLGTWVPNHSIRKIQGLKQRKSKKDEIVAGYLLEEYHTGKQLRRISEWLQSPAIAIFICFIGIAINWINQPALFMGPNFFALVLGCLGIIFCKEISRFTGIRSWVYDPRVTEESPGFFVALGCLSVVFSVIFRSLIL